MLALLALLGFATRTLAAPVTSESSLIRWISCNDNIPPSLNSTIAKTTTFPSSFACGQLTAPLNHNDPDSPSIIVGFTINRSANSQGALFINTGGPGAEVASEGFRLAVDAPAEAGLPDFRDLRMFDIVTPDPRGMWSSQNINCSFEAFASLNTSLPATQVDFDQAKDLSRRFGDSCAIDSAYPAFLSYFGSKYVARDMDLLRRALGYAKIHYIGLSYGTFLGQQLVQQFPNTIDRLVFDGAFPNGIDLQSAYSNGLAAATRRLDRLDAYCLASSTCPFFSQGKGAVQRAWQGVIAAAAQGAYGNVTAAQIRGFYAFTASLTNPEDTINIIALAASPARNVSLLGPPGISPVALAAIPQTPLVFATDVAYEDYTFEQVDGLRQGGLSNDPYGFVDSFGSLFVITSLGINKENHGVSETIRIDRPYLLVTSDFDANTPTEWTTLAWQQSPKAVLAVRHGDGHCTFTRPDMPINPARDAIISYLQTGDLPAPRNDALITVYAVDADRTSRPTLDPYSVKVGIIAGSSIDPAGVNSTSGVVESPSMGGAVGLRVAMGSLTVSLLAITFVNRF